MLWEVVHTDILAPWLAHCSLGERPSRVINLLPINAYEGEKDIDSERTGKNEKYMRTYLISTGQLIFYYYSLSNFLNFTKLQPLQFLLFIHKFSSIMPSIFSIESKFYIFY